MSSFPPSLPVPPLPRDPFAGPEWATIPIADRPVVMDLLAGLSTTKLLETCGLWSEEDARRIEPFRGHGFLDLRGTSAGTTDRLLKYIRYFSNLGHFPYFLLDQQAKAAILVGQAATARPGPRNPFRAEKPKGVVPFVIMINGECRIGPTFRRIEIRPLPSTGVNHAFIAQMASQVAFAGELKFGGMGEGAAGVLISWSNESGGYRSTGNDAYKVGLPMNLFSGRGPLSAPKDFVNAYGAGRSKINWGRHGPPESAQSKGDYWYR
ncbi:hypothetical protein H7849_07590 [Alloacidobacterium dinghuense]|uniref:Uncharacterized protein n=1 Tax=Alloacidobacterium dinghuense TaxID=2763107 RepID=A0A7G8BMK1_9BACT|nr:hypothetical protein [Alloacidobacterium dinghuense]QNI33771.1 hypothetical protein H7849_07590 [Alloacidobacterium dinghuense]